MKLNSNSNLYSLVMYVIMGGFTTLVNIVVFWLFATELHIDYRIANTIAWVASVLFAYVTNKIYVFRSHTATKKETLSEMGSFFGFRFLSYLMDLGVMIVLISGFSMNENLAKVFTNVLVMVANYVFSKLFIFKGKSSTANDEGFKEKMEQIDDRGNLKVKLRVLVVVVFLFYLYLAFNTPLTHDDWTWATAAGIHRLHTWFHDYNGRYLGNLLELLITRSAIVRVLLMSIFATLIVVLTGRLTRRQGLGYYLLSLLAFLSVPASMFAQTYGWAAGFSNYIPGAVFTLVYLNMVKNIFLPDLPSYRKSLVVWVVPLGIVSQLFVEHVTIYNVLVAIAVIVYTFRKFRKVYSVHVLYLVSTLIGAVMMFSNGAYRVIFTGHDTYRTVALASHHVSLLHRVIHALGLMYPFLVMNNMLLNVLLAAFAVTVITVSARTGRTIATLKNNLMFILIAYPLYKIIIVDALGVHFFGSYAKEFEGFISVLFLLALFLTAILFVDVKTVRLKLVFYLASVLVLAAPFLVVTPFGPRCFLSSYTFFVLFVLELATYLVEEKKMKLRLNRPLALSAVALLLTYAYVFTFIGHTSRARSAEIHSQVASHVQTVTVTKLPFQQFLWHSTPIPGTYQYETFKLYFRIPKSDSLHIISYVQWKHGLKK